MDKPTADYKDGFEDGYEEGHIGGFERAVELIMGNSKKWTRYDRDLFNRVTRKYFGKKRNVQVLRQD